MMIRVAQGSPTDGDETLLVNESNTNMTLETGISGSIRKACGTGYLERIESEMTRNFGGPMAPGCVLITDAGAHPSARWVAHVALVDDREGAQGGPHPTLALVASACQELWRRIEKVPEQVTVAMVALGAGTLGFGVREPVRIACETLRKHVKQRSQTRIRGCTFYGLSLVEYLVTCDVVATHFPGVWEELPRDVRAHLRQVRGAR